MPFPADWPPRLPTGTRSLRFYVAATATANFADRAYTFVGGSTVTPTPYLRPGDTTTPIAIGVAQNPGSPLGGGRNPNDKDSAGNPPPLPAASCNALRIYNDGSASLEFSFDGTNVHGSIVAGQAQSYYNRFESGIAVRGVGGTPAFRIEAW